MHFLYNLSVFFYSLAIHIASAFNSKAKLWVNGRKNVFETLSSKIQNPKSKNVIWFHCASLGEFEQGRPLIEKIRQQHPELKIVLTFFSPSGYEIRKNYSGADHIFYLPIDSPKNAKKFVEIVNPKFVFFVKYEFWFNYLNEIKNKNIPLYLVSGIFREDQHFFKWYGGWFKKQLNCFTTFFLQDEASFELLKNNNFKNILLTGDTRFDRVFEISKNIKSIPLIQQFKQNSDVFIAGSSWAEDEKIISSLKSEGLKLIIVPHEVDEKHIQLIIRQFSFSKTLRFSQANENNVKDAQILIIDNIGMLSSIYQYGTIAYIGGGFGKGIHNILEAATFGLPVIFGPNYQKFSEAKELIHLGGAFSIKDVSEFKKTIELLEDKTVLQTASHIAKYYVSSRIGASDKILSSIAIK
ncbi:MAG: 3-deoxy-D-manno-octulosonic acid transferase [Bacteroidia bacterium]